MKTRQKHEFGDFQTPPELACTIIRIIQRLGLLPAAIVEPTCGIGNFLAASAKAFPNAATIQGLDVNVSHLQRAAHRFAALEPDARIHLQNADMFVFKWRQFFETLPQPVLVIGNPPWVTAADLGSLASTNLPAKSNFQNHSGLDALTGKSNFDIAEWLLLKLLECLESKNATLALLIKESVARKVLLHAWQKNLPIKDSIIYRIDAKAHFNAAVDACLFVCRVADSDGEKFCSVTSLAVPDGKPTTVGFEDGYLISDIEAFRKTRHLLQDEPDAFRWRSGIKHDCSRVMEFTRAGDTLLNGLGETAQIEDGYLFPMLKGSEVAAHPTPLPTRAMLVPQARPGEDTALIAHHAPLTWRYLCDHGPLLDARTSAIYKRRPRFSVFGVGPYSFMPWKIAICSLYKKLHFSMVGPHREQPVVFDDTVYHLSFDSKNDATLIYSLITSEPARTFYHSMIFWDAKRAISADLLNRLDIHALARELKLDIPFAQSRRRSVKHRANHARTPHESASLF